MIMMCVIVTRGVILISRAFKFLVSKTSLLSFFFHKHEKHARVDQLCHLNGWGWYLIFEPLC